MQDIILTPQQYGEIESIAAKAFESRLLNSEIRNAQAAFFVAAVGAELGLSPLQSLQNIYVIKGKAILSAHAILALVKRRRDICSYFRLVESTAESATYETLRTGEPEPTRLTFTIEDAKRANLLNNPTWKAHPSAMLRARCGTALARAVYPDLILGVYDEYEAPEIRGSDTVSRMETEPPVALDASRVPPALPAAEPTGPFAPTEEEKIAAKIEAFRAQLEACDNNADLYEIAKDIRSLPEANRESLKSLYVARKQAIAAAQGQPA